MSVWRVVGTAPWGGRKRLMAWQGAATLGPCAQGHEEYHYSVSGMGAQVTYRLMHNRIPH